VGRLMDVVSTGRSGSLTSKTARPPGAPASPTETTYAWPRVTQTSTANRCGTRDSERRRRPPEDSASPSLHFMRSASKVPRVRTVLLTQRT
jgi:hypothetical protein